MSQRPVDEILTVNHYFVCGDKTFFKERKLGKPSTGKEKVLFIEGVVKLIGYLEGSKYSGSWVCSCRGVGKTLNLETRTITLSFDAFTSVVKFTKELQAAFGNGLIVNGKVTKADLTDYLLYLKQEHTSNGHARRYKVAEKIGHVGDGYWFFNSKIQIRHKIQLNSSDLLYIDEGERLKSLYMDIELCLLNRNSCLEANEKVLQLISNYGINTQKALNAISFSLSRLCVTAQNDDGCLDTGETNILLLYGEKNLGKSLTQHLIHYGQGGTSTNHALIVSGGNGYTSGTSSISTQDICRRTSLVVNINDIKNSDGQGEVLLQIHEKLQQGSSKRGLWASNCAGVIISSNKIEPERLIGRVIRIEFEKEIISKENHVRLQQLKKHCQDYKGFLVSWVMHFVHMWIQNVHQAKNVISSVLMENLEDRQQRWCNGIALLFYTKFVYCKSLGVEEISLKVEVENFLSANVEEDVYTKIDKNIKLRVAEKSCHVLSWLNWQTKLTLKTGQLVPCVAVHTNVFNLKFVDMRKEELEEALNLVSETAMTRPVYFCKDQESSCTLADQRKREKNCASLRGHKIPISWLSPSLNEWFDNADLDGDIATVEEKEVVDLEELQALEDKIVSDLVEYIEGSEVETEMETEEMSAIELMTPRTQIKVDSMSPLKRTVFLSGFTCCQRLFSDDETISAAKKKRLAADTEKESSDSEVSSNNDNEVEAESTTMKIRPAVDTEKGSSESEASDSDSDNVNAKLDESKVEVIKIKGRVERSSNSREEESNAESDKEKHVSEIESDVWEKDVGENGSEEKTINKEERDNLVERECEGESNIGEMHCSKGIVFQVAENDSMFKNKCEGERKCFQKVNVLEGSVKERSFELHKGDEVMDESRKRVDKSSIQFPEGVFGAMPCVKSTPISCSQPLKGRTKRKKDVQKAKQTPYKYCTCKKEYETRIMVECSGQRCPGENWFHLKCVGLRRSPPKKEKWFCGNCKTV